MMLHRKLVSSTAFLFSRNISTTSVNLLDIPSSKPLSDKRQHDLDEDKKSMLWREKPAEKKGAWYSKFSLFMNEDDDSVKTTANPSVVPHVLQPIDLRPKSVKHFFKTRWEKQERFLQQFIPERHEILGNDLAAAHFLVHRGGKVKFVGNDGWVTCDDSGRYELPDRYVENVVLEAINCEGMELYYEGLENVRRLKYLRYASFKDIESFDDWCLDRVSGAEFESLEILNLSGTKISDRGLQALYRIPTLRKLIVDDPYRNPAWKLTIAMLQEIMPNLEIVEAQKESKAVEN